MKSAAYWKHTGPTDLQLLLLQAVVFHDKRAVEAYEQWRSLVVFDDIDFQSRLLLPALYRNISPLGVTCPVLNRCRGVYRYSWVNNQRLKKKAGEVIHELSSQGVPVLLLKGAALAEFYYHDDGARYMLDIDILVPAGEVTRAISCLNQANLRSPLFSTPAMSKATLGYRHSAGFYGNAANLDLHWHLTRESSCTDLDNKLFQQTKEVVYQGSLVHILNPAAQLFHTCIHGTYISRTHSLRWIVDALKINEVADEIEWGEMVRMAAYRGLSLQLKHALGFLRDYFDAPVPVAITQQLGQVSVPSYEQKTFKIITTYQPYKRLPRLWQHLQLAWLRLARCYQGKCFCRRLFLYPRYLRIIAGQESYLMTLKMGIRKLRDSV